MKRSMIVFLAVAACGQVQTEPTSEDEVAITTSSEIRFTPATVEMVAAALTGDPDRMAAAIPAASTCHAPSSCGSPYICLGWSSFASCGETFCTGSCVVGGGDCASNPNCLLSQRLGQTQQSSRVCRDGVNVCTEWRTTVRASGCGCGGVE